MNVYSFLHKNRILICSILILSGLIFILLSTLSLLYSEGDSGVISTANDILGDWAYWVLLLGLAVLIIGIFYIYEFIKLRKEFKELIEIGSKAKFIKNMDRIEELAWRLHPKYEKIVIKRKSELKIK
jgi:phosphotransferase system  glucose/maltose/N-acetylglucosamine-specific IIC component